LIHIKASAVGDLLVRADMDQDDAMTTAEQTSEAAPIETTLYELAGGEAMVRRLADRFYEIMDSDPAARTIRAMHAEDLMPIRQLLFEYLSGWFGGPQLYFDRPEHRCIVSAHRPFAIGEAERDAWMTCMRKAMFDCELPAELQVLLDEAFLRMATVFSRAHGAAVRTP
jgi:hemoglobin